MRKGWGNMPIRLNEKYRDIPAMMLRPVPVVFYQPALRRIVRHIARRHARLFDRLGIHSRKAFLIDPTNAPFVLLLRPDPQVPELTAHRDATGLDYQAKISGSFVRLLRLLDGREDGDAIFFSRHLKVEGDTEAVVSLRNALDDVEGSVAEDVAQLFGVPGKIGLSVFRRLEV